MFDNLKKKLGSFRKDAEEAAEENVEEVDEDELEDAELEATDTAEVESAAADTAEAESAASEPAEAESTESALEEDELGDATPSEAETESSEAEADTDGTTPETETAEAPDTTDETVDDVAEPERELETETEPPTESAGESVESDPESAPETSDTQASSETVESWVTQPVPDADESSDGDFADDTERDSVAIDASVATDADDDAAAADDTDPEDGSTGFGNKARSLVKGKFVIEEEDLEGPLHELEMALLSSDVEMGVAEEILDNIRDELVGETRTFTTSTGDVVEEALSDAIYDVISVGQFDFDERIAVEDKPVTLVFTGVNGVGKTTSIAKLSRYFEERGYSTVMANGDTYRAGANEQIQEHADALDTKLISHQQGGDPAAVLYDAVEYAEANNIDIVLGDTAGRLHTDEGLMDQLEKIGRVVDPDMTLFVDEAVAGQDAVNRAREFNEAAEIDGAILTKADADSNGGAAISIAQVTGKPILFLGVGQGYDHLERFDPDEMIDRLLGDEA
ncbi:signal recognition particle-docking protein FtsY [Natronorubrum texcoconense]|uniref:Signal recognition particle receptor FtsY n=1 Tax=Natronorubrum texcoconense TaxID=1095776 RepID=A0A1G9BGA1_9EURY|nr:signal recognition particle-docking protein FtsY [Natronorubrum texcoconense]SDK38556.1 signal recognition particle-docking protein FtsY [Natronorubrum texcoconense]